MRCCLAFAWLLGMSNAMLLAGDGNPSPITSIPLPRIFRPTASSFLATPEIAPRKASQTFDFHTSIPTDGNLVEVHVPTSNDAALLGELEPDDIPRHSSEIVRTQYQYADPIAQEPQRESSYPPQPSGSQTPSNQAVPLDGALRELQPEDENDKHQKSLGSYSSFGWIGGSNDRLGMLELDFKPTSRVWFDPTQEERTNLGVEWGAKWLTGPNFTDLPPQLFQVLINVGQTFQIDERLKVDAMLSPGWFTDFSNKGVEAFRLPWHIVGFYKMDSDWHSVLGVTDLSRDDIRYLPVIGLVYAPPDDVIRLDLVFPKPRIAWKVAEAKLDSYWLTLGGELGGGSWAISRADRTYDVVTYRDYRLLAGLEARSPKGTATRLEAGWIFDRSVQYRSNVGNYNATDSFMVRISSDY